MVLTGPAHADAYPSAQTPQRVVIVDDSQTMRKWVRMVLEADPRLIVVGEAEDALQAREVIRTLQPDVITLDIVMPKMDGLDFLERLMRLFPTPVVVLSSLTAHDPQAKERALALGAKDCLAKPTHASDAAFTRDFQDRVYHAAKPQTKVNTPLAPARRALSRLPPLILIGASTGGVTALETVLSQVDPNGPPILVVQHMPGNFLFSFVNRLNATLKQDVRLAKAGLSVARGDIVFAPTCDEHMLVEKTVAGWTCCFGGNTEGALHVPSVDRMFSSALSFAEQVIAVILTGLGKDGADAMAQLAQRGAVTIGQDEATSVVYGMPRAAFEAGGVQHQLALEQIGPAIDAAVAEKANHKKGQGA